MVVKQVVTTDKNSQDGKATNWHLFDSMDIRATEIIQTWKQVNTGKHISIRNFCPWGDDNYC